MHVPHTHLEVLQSPVNPQAGLVGHAVGSKLPCAARRHVRPLARRTGSGQSSPEPANRSSTVQCGRGTCWPQPQHTPRRPRLQHHCKCLLTSAARAARRACANAAGPSVQVGIASWLVVAAGVTLHSEIATSTSTAQCCWLRTGWHAGRWTHCDRCPSRCPCRQSATGLGSRRRRRRRRRAGRLHCLQRSSPSSGRASCTRLSPQAPAGSGSCAHAHSARLSVRTGRAVHSWRSSKVSGHRTRSKLHRKANARWYHGCACTTRPAVHRGAQCVC